MGSPSALRKINDRAALYALQRSGPLSRGDLEQAVGVSKPAAAELLRRLEESGLARRAGYRAGGPGPQAQLWTINERGGFAVGLDVTDPGIDAVVADLSGKPLGEARIEVADTDDAIAAAKQVLRTVARRAGVKLSDVRHVAVGISGLIDPVTGILSHADHIPAWLGFDVQGKLQKALKVPVSVENDVNLVVSDEAARGRAVGCRDVLLLWMSRGVATAIIADGRLLRGARGSAGELDFVSGRLDGPTASELIATEGILALARAHGVEHTAIPALLGQAVARASGSERHDGFLTALAERIAGVLAVPVALVDPEVIILSGDVGTSGGDELADRVRFALHGMLTHRPRVVAGTGYDNSVRQGALDAALGQLRETVFGSGPEHPEGATPA